MNGVVGSVACSEECSAATMAAGRGAAMVVARVECSAATMAVGRGAAMVVARVAGVKRSTKIFEPLRD